MFRHFQRTALTLILPFLFAWYPLFFLYARNLQTTTAAELIVPLLLLSAATCMALLPLLRLLPSREHAATLVSVGWLFFFSYRHTYRFIRSTLDLGPELLRHRHMLPLYLLLASACLIWLWRLRRGYEPLHRLLLVMGCVLIVFPLGSIVCNRPDDTGHAQVMSAAAGVTAAGFRPDIYHLVLDSYARADVLRDYYALDNASFLGWLQAQGFSIADAAACNYPFTVNSTATMLNRAYLDPGMQPRCNPLELIQHNAVVRDLRARGYSFIAFRSGADGLNFRTADLLVGDELLGLSALQNSLLSLTAAQPLLKYLPVNQASVHHRFVRSKFALLSTVAREHRPAYVFAHFLVPHPPFVFAEDGSFRFTESVFSYRDGSQYPGSRAAYAANYRAQVIAVNRLVREAVAGILSRDPDAVIIVSADHGARQHYHFDDVAQTDFRECLPILFATRLPERCRVPLPADLTLVNAYRWLENALFATGHDLLPNRHYYATQEAPLVFIPVSDTGVVTPYS